MALILNFQFLDCARRTKKPPACYGPRPNSELQARLDQSFRFSLVFLRLRVIGFLIMLTITNEAMQAKKRKIFAGITKRTGITR
jgi:hypothetical protein